MTLNALEWSFCVKIWSELGIQWLAFWLSKKTVRKFTELRICQRQKMYSLARDCTGDIRVVELSNGITEQEASKQ